MSEPTISLRDVKERLAFHWPYVRLTVPERDALVEAVEATQGPDGCTFCGKPAMVSHTNHREDCPMARFSDVEAGT